MMTNLGKLDRAGRLAVAALLLLGAFTMQLFGSGALFWIALAVAAVFAVTALVGMCPLYRLVGLKTCRDC